MIADGSHLAVLSRVLSAGPGIAVQARNPAISTRAYFKEAQALSALCSEHGAPFFVSARVDVALALNAHLHLPSRAVTAAQVREVLPAGRLISVAVHDEAEAARATGADFALVSPVFAPGSKPGDLRPRLGPEGFNRLAGALPCPAFALGGITADNCPSTAVGAAVISFVLESPNPSEAARALLARLR